jgi:hypothetical protein
MINQKHLENLVYINYLGTLMMQDIYVKLNPGLPWQSSIQREEDYFHRQNKLRFKKETSKVLHMEHSFVWC